uniref:Uncharacterized protein n=1 Tax=Timema monikensis TaxID=170555 RepID=A0A7R9HQV7_9NEOP|nr:unnamed protein product [Timema monikensis]
MVFSIFRQNDFKGSGLKERVQTSSSNTPTVSSPMAFLFRLTGETTLSDSIAVRIEELQVASETMPEPGLNSHQAWATPHSKGVGVIPTYRMQG